MAGVLGWIFDQVMKHPVAAFHKGVQRPFVVQERALRTIVQRNADTEFGQKHDFKRLLRISKSEIWKQYRKTVPIRSYADFATDIERMKNGEKNILVPGSPDMFSLTSGTTSEPKFCPINRDFIKEHHSQHLLWMYHVYKDHPATNSGKYLVAASPAEMGRTAGGIPYGAMSGKQLATQSIPVRRRQATPFQLQELPSADDRWFSMLLFALAEKDLRVVTSANPSTLIAMANRLDRESERLIECVAKGHPFARSGGTPLEKKIGSLFRPNAVRARELREILRTDGSLSPAAAWPNIEMLLTWQGGSSSFYLPHVAALWGTTTERCLGLRASEGTFSIPLADGTASGTLAIGGHALEFVPESVGDPAGSTPTLLAGQLDRGGLYRLIISTSGGLYRYDMGDLVRVTGFNQRTPVVAFERRAGSVLSATGEKVTEDQVVASMDAATAAGPLLNGFSVTYEIEDGCARYVLGLECAGGADMPRHRNTMLRARLTELLAVFDDELMHRNCEYQSKRDDGRIRYPRIVLFGDGTYDAFRSRQAALGRPENQIKLPVMVQPVSSGPLSVSAGDFFAHASIIEQPVIAPRSHAEGSRTFHIQ